MDDKHADHDAVDAQDNVVAAGSDRPDATASEMTGATAVRPGTTGTDPDADRAATDHASLADLDDPGHLFDQTNGLADGLNGDSDGTADADDASAGERDDEGTGLNPGTDAGTGIVGFNVNDRI